MTSSYPQCVPVLDDGRVRLRAMTPADLPASVEQSTDPETVRWTTVPSPYGPDDAADYLEHIGSQWEDEGGVRIFAVELAGADGEEGAPFAGLIDLRPGASPQHPWEVGFATHPAVRGRGVMTAAMRLGAAWAFEQGAPSLYWYANVGNWGSRRVAWRVGMTDHGTLPQRVPGRDGTVMDAWCASLLPGQEMSPRTPWINPPVLTDGSVRLRPWRDDDRASVEEPDHPSHHVPARALPTAQTWDAWLDRRRHAMASGSSVNWCVADAQSDVALGEVLVFVHGGTLVDGDTAELGYFLYPRARGHGVAKAAAALAAEHALTPRESGGLGLRRLVAQTAADNAASNAVLSFAGFSRWGHEAAATAPDGSVGPADHWERVRP